MHRPFLAHSIFFFLIVSLLANSLGWAFLGEVFNHELEKHQHTNIVIQSIHEGHQHDETSDEMNLMFTAHTCLNLAYQPFYILNLPFPILFVAEKEIPAEYLSQQAPESILDSPFRPPRLITI